MNLSQTINNSTANFLNKKIRSWNPSLNYSFIECGKLIRVYTYIPVYNEIFGDEKVSLLACLINVSIKKENHYIEIKSPYNISLATKDDLKKVLKKNGWLFNWKKEYAVPGRLIYKLTAADKEEMEGLISLEPRKTEQFIEMPLIESAPHNRGPEKRYHRVPVTLVAFACQMSLDMGFGGYVAFTAKTKLVEHYRNILGAEQMGSSARMLITSETGEFLVNSHIKSS